MVSAPGQTQVIDVPTPGVGPNDVLVKMRACGICGSDAFYISIGGLCEGYMPLGHEPAGEVVGIGSAVTGIAVGDHVVINPMVAPSGIIGNGGPSGALAEYLLIEDAVRGRSLEVVPDHIPFEVIALNEPMAVARHGVNQCRPSPGDEVLVFGAGPIGLGATIAFDFMGGVTREVLVEKDDVSFVWKISMPEPNALFTFYEGTAPIDASDATGWHVYSMDWSPEGFVFKVDDVPYYAVTRRMVEARGPWAYDTPKHLIVNLALGGAYPQGVNKVDAPYVGLPAPTVDLIKADKAVVLVDWIKVSR